MSLHPANYDEYLKRTQSANARPRKGLKRGRIKPRKTSKRETVEGDPEREIHDECDELIRKIVKARDNTCINSPFGCNGPRQVGHYISRSVLAVRWDLENCNLQCGLHNAAHEYDTTSYRVDLAEKYGGATVRRLERIGRENPTLDYVTLLAIRDGLREELKVRTPCE